MRDAAEILANACRRYGSTGTYDTQTYLANEGQLGVSTFRTAIRYLESIGQMSREAVFVGGEHRTLYRCHWLEDPPNPPGRIGARAPIPGGRAPKSAPDKKEEEFTEEETKTTTSRTPTQDPEPGTDVQVEVVVQASLEEQRGEAHIATAPDPEVPPEPAVAAALAAIPNPEVRSALESRSRTWTGVYRAEWVARAIAEVGARAARSRVHDPGGYGDSILANWSAEGKSIMRVAKPPPRPAQEVRAASQAEGEARAEKRRQEARIDAERAAIGARWDALPADSRRPIEARALADCPLAASKPQLLRSLCMAILAETEPAGSP